MQPPTKHAAEKYIGKREFLDPSKTLLLSGTRAERAGGMGSTQVGGLTPSGNLITLPGLLMKFSHSRKNLRLPRGWSQL
jgi:hypothetical protein